MNSDRRIQWVPLGADDGPGTPVNPGEPQEGDGRTREGGKARLTPAPWQEPGELPDDEFPWMLTTGRQLFHYNVGIMTRRTDLMKLGSAQEQTLRIHPADAREAEIQAADDASRHGAGRLLKAIIRRTVDR